MSTTKEKIIQAAIKLFAQHSTDACSVALLTKEANVATGSFYTHFASKEDFIAEILLMSRQKVLIETYTIDPNKSVKENFTEYLRAIIKYMSNNTDEFKFIVHHLFSHCGRTRLKDGLNHESFKQILTILHQGKSEGLVKDIDDMILTTYVFGGVFFFMSNMIEKKIELSEANIHPLLALAWDSIKI